MSAKQIDEPELKNRYGDLPVWGVVSAFAADSFYEGLTLAQAKSLLDRETREPGRSATLVLVVRTKEGDPL